MGDAEIDIGAFVEAVKMNLSDLPNGTIITTEKPNRKNCLADESPVVWKDGRVVQDIILRLRNVESGELELQLLWTAIPAAAALSSAPLHVREASADVFLPDDKSLKHTARLRISRQPFLQIDGQKAH
ncbi:hypothetical protein B296_00044269 [Ensete ventricosum]|uniref:C2 domain-containing protein n=1 Tax=Ensete ventricosum TaxID=4639 RepID=A0A426YTX7_ENSVE|nr:hypothetical protein B296_00044269 [Ensete ventricosum]